MRFYVVTWRANACFETVQYSESELELVLLNSHSFKSCSLPLNWSNCSEYSHLVSIKICTAGVFTRNGYIATNNWALNSVSCAGFCLHFISNLRLIWKPPTRRQTVFAYNGPMLATTAEPSIRLHRLRKISLANHELFPMSTASNSWD